MQNMWLVTFGQLLGMSPLLLIYLGGIILSAIWWRRAPRAAMLALLGLALMLLVSLVGLIVQNWIIANRGNAASMGQAVLAVSLVRMFLHAGGLVLLIAAVFVGRPREHTGGFDVAPLPPYAGRAQG